MSTIIDRLYERVSSVRDAGPNRDLPSQQWIWPASEVFATSAGWRPLLLAAICPTSVSSGVSKIAAVMSTSASLQIIKVTVDHSILKSRRMRSSRPHL